MSEKPPRFSRRSCHHIDAERLQDAASSLRRAAALRPDHPVAWFVLGLTLRTLGQGTDALAPLRAALRLRPDDPDTLFHLAGLLMEQARATEAVPVLRRLVRLRPGHPDAAFMLGNALMAVEEPEQAETAYRVAVLLRPDSADAHNNLGGSVLAQCRPDDAVGSFRRAIRIAPACPDPQPDHLMGIVSLRGRRGGAEGFVDTAAIVASLDLVVACDSVVANLAGAMGKPVFLALPWLADWRWMRLSDRTPWYPATRLFRMARRNDWDGTMARIAEAVRARIAAGGQEEERRGA